jgi:hypothetical protein
VFPDRSQHVSLIFIGDISRGFEVMCVKGPSLSNISVLFTLVYFFVSEFVLYAIAPCH